MEHAVQPLRLANNLGITFEASLPKLIADDSDGMRGASHVFARQESAAQDGMHTDGVEIVGRDDASDGALGTVADAERCAGDLTHKQCVEKGAVFPQVEKVGPGKRGCAGFAASGSSQRHESFLVHDRRIGAEEDAFDPAEDGGVGANAQREAKNGEDGKARTAPKHAEADAQVHGEMFEP